MGKRIWGLFEAVCFYAAYYASSFIAAICLVVFYTVYFAVLNHNDRAVFNAYEFSTKVTDAAGSSEMVGVLIANILTLLLYTAIIYARGGTFKKYMALEKTPLRALAGGVFAGAGLWYLSQELITRFFKGTDALREYAVHMQDMLGGDLWISVLVTVVVAPIIEELVFRGALFRALERFSNKWIAVIITSVLFAIAHVDPLHMCYAFVLGILLATLRSISGKLLPCIALHLTFNLMNYIEIPHEIPIIIAVVVAAGGYALALYKKDCQG